MWGKVFQGLDGGVSRVGEVVGLMIAEDRAFEPTPEVFHRIEFGTCRGEPAEFDVQMLGQLPGRRRGVGRATIEKEDDVPTAPRLPNVFEMVTEALAVPARGQIDAAGAGRDVESGIHGGLAAVARDGNFDWFADL